MTTALRWNLEAHVADILPVERALLGACLYPGVVSPPLLATEFYLEAHRRMWTGMQDLIIADASVDLVTLAHELARRGELDEIGGPVYLAGCFVEAHIPAYVSPLARKIRDAARARALHSLGEELAGTGLSEAEIEVRLAEIPGPLAGALYEPADEWAKIVAAWRDGRIRAGFTEFDEITGGFGRGDFVIVGGRTSHGKSAWLCDLSLRLGERGVDVDYVTLEESRMAITRRLVGNKAAVSIRRLKDGDLQPFEFEKSEEAVRWLQGLPLTVTGLDHVRTLEENAVVGAVAASRAAVVIVDHIQQINTSAKESRVYGIERVAKRLQAVALRDGKIVILAAQLSRQTEARRGAPQLSDLRDSGGLEQIGRVILLLYWPWKHDPDRSHEEYELYVAKQSDGGTGLVKLRFEAWCGRFSEWPLEALGR